jgi:hypothetical protein
MPQRPATESEFWSRADPDGDCLIWQRSTFSKGYGRIELFGEVLAHRVAYIFANGPIPEGMLVLHSCDTPSCIQPRHLFLGDQGDNMRDMSSKGRAANQQKDRCTSGHLFTDDNTYIDPRGARYCLTCRRRRDRERYHRLAAQGIQKRGPR